MYSVLIFIASVAVGALAIYGDPHPQRAQESDYAELSDTATDIAREDSDAVNERE